jgi:hypothetical protein
MPATNRVKRDWTDERMTVSTSKVVEITGLSWKTAGALMRNGTIRSVQVGIQSQPYYRTSMRNLKAFMDGKQPTG